VEALRTELAGADAQQHPEDADPLAAPSPLALVWDLIGPAASAVEGLLAMEAHLTTSGETDRPGSLPGVGPALPKSRPAAK
jgi:hypothetical protein